MRKHLIIACVISLIAGGAHAVTVGGKFNVTAVNVTNVNAAESKATLANYNAAMAGTLAPGAVSDTFTYDGLLDFFVGQPQRAAPYEISTWLDTGTGTVSGLDDPLASRQLSFPSIGAGTATTTFFLFSLVNKMDAADFTVIHDDGMAIFEGTTRLGGREGPTSRATTKVDGYTGTGPFSLLYVATNGNPSILNVAAEFDGPGGITSVPVPASLPLLLAGLGGIALLRRRRIRA